MEDSLQNVAALLESTNGRASSKLIKKLLRYGLDVSYEYAAFWLMLTAITQNCNTDSLKSIFTAVTSHQLYNSIFHNTNLRPRLLTLLFAIVKKDASLAEKQWLESLARVYEGTLSSCDQIILSIFKWCEQKRGIFTFKLLCCWNSKDIHIVQNVDSLALIDSATMARTINCYPYARNILSLEWEEGEAIDDASMYDPAFFIPLGLHLLTNDSRLLDPLNLIQCNIFGLAIMGLSSTSLATRKVANAFICSMFDIIFNSNIRDKNQVILLLDCFRNGLVKQKLQMSQVPSLITNFVAHSLVIMIQAENDLYPLINQFLLQRPFIDIDDIPLFYKLVFSSSDSCKRHRMWMLKLLRDGLNTHLDFAILKGRFVFEIVLTLFNSKISDKLTKSVILEVKLANLDNFKGSGNPGHGTIPTYQPEYLEFL
jgi:hypothetical protein